LKTSAKNMITSRVRTNSPRHDSTPHQGTGQ
jgi:hypothetical protein